MTNFFLLKSGTVCNITVVGENIEMPSQYYGITLQSRHKRRQPVKKSVDLGADSEEEGDRLR